MVELCPKACGFNWICQDQSHTMFHPQLHSRSQSFVGTPGNCFWIAVVTQSRAVRYGNSISVVWSSHSRLRTRMELWVEHCVWLVLTDPIETTSFWTKFDHVKNLTISGKYTNFLEIKNNYGRTNGEKDCFDDFATSPIRREHSTTYPITIDNYLIALFDVVSWNHIPWIGSRFITSWFKLPLRNLQFSVLLSAYMKTTFDRLEFFARTMFSRITSGNVSTAH